MEFLIASSALTIFAIHPEEVAARVITLITLVLAATAFKFVTTSMLPVTPHVTILDVYNYGSMLFLAVLLFVNCLLARLQQRGYTGEPISYDDIFAAASIVILLLFSLAFGLKCWWLHCTQTAQKKTASAKIFRHDTRRAKDRHSLQ